MLTRSASTSLANTFTPLTVLMTTARSGHIGLTMQHNGKVLIVGGTSAGQPVATAEVYDPVLGRFWEVGSLNAARQLFAANGFEASTTRDIADAAGIASGTLFNYFATKEDLLASLAAEAVAGANLEFEERATALGSFEEELFAFVSAGFG